MESWKKAYPRDEIRDILEARLKAERDRISDLVAAEDRGHEEGFRQGYSQGFSQGLMQARKERLIEIALQLRQMGMPPGLPLDELP